MFYFLNTRLRLNLTDNQVKNKTKTRFITIKKRINQITLNNKNGFKKMLADFHNLEMYIEEEQ